MASRQNKGILQVSKNLQDTGSYQSTRMKKEIILQKLKDKGCRITNQRLLILSIILENDCNSCKEIYYKASRIDSKIGTATVYRFMNMLEDIGAINRKNMFKVIYAEDYAINNVGTIILEDEIKFELSKQKWNLVIKTGLIACGYLKS